jgi:hypothetical protein
MGLGIGIGNSILFYNASTSIDVTAAFKERVLADGGTYEANQCLVDSIDTLETQGLLDKVSLMITPNAVKVGKIYAYKPTDDSGDGDFDRSSTATRVNSSGLIENMANNIARIDYPSAGSCPHLLLEPQSTNLITYSEDFSNASWLKTRSDMVLSSELSPNGIDNAYKLEGTGTGTSYIYDGYSLTSGVPYSVSVFVKNINISLIAITVFGNGYARFDLSNNTVVSSTGDVSLPKIEEYQNGWVRLSCVFTPPTTQNFNIGFPVINLLGEQCYFWGAQLEALPYATSYIPTNGSAVTRVKDVANNFGDVNTFNSEEGVLFVEMAALSDDGTYRYLTLSDGGSSNRIIVFYYPVSNTIRTIVSSGGTNYFDSTYTLSDVTIFQKVAIKYKANDFALWVNGVERAFDNSGSAPIGLNVFNFSSGSGSNNFKGKVKQVQIYKEALTDLELQTLTTI